MKHKDITLYTGAFDLTIHWNASLVATHLAILVGVIATLIFAKQPEVVALCRLVLLIDVLVIGYSVLKGAYTETKDAGGNPQKKAPPKKEKLDVEVKSETKDKPVKEEEKPKQRKPKEEVIRNKVPIPTATKADNPTPRVVRAEELSDEDWDDLFRM